MSHLVSFYNPFVKKNFYCPACCYIDAWNYAKQQVKDGMQAVTIYQSKEALN